MPTEPEQRDHTWYRGRTVAVFQGGQSPFVASINTTDVGGCLILHTNDGEVIQILPARHGWEREGEATTLLLASGEKVSPWYLLNVNVPAPMYEWLVAAVASSFPLGLGLMPHTDPGKYVLIDRERDRFVGEPMSKAHAELLVSIAGGQ